jgi:hypothetical protein
MIEEDLSDRERPEDLEVRSPEVRENPVSAEERYERHAHYPATFLVENQPALASRLERALFERGFEVLHLDGDEASPYALLETIRATQRVGAISIYSGDPLDAGVKERLGAEVRDRLFDISRKKENADDEEVFRRALALADTLRFRKPQNNQEEVN